MSIREEREFTLSRVFIMYFWLLAGLLALLCAARGRLIFQSGVAALLAVAAVMAVAFFLYRRSSMKTAEERAKLLSPVLALACACGLSLHMPAQEKSLIWLILWGLCLCFLRYALMKKSSLSVRRAAALLGALFALLVLLGSQLKAYDRLELLYTRDMGDIAYALLCAAGEAFLFTAAINVIFARSLEGEGAVLVPEKPRPGKLAIYMGIILLCWLPYYYAFYPGILSWDSLDEMFQQLGMKAVSNHHPYIHQLLIGACLRAAGWRQDLGVGIYSAVQMLIMSFSFSLCVSFLESCGVRKGIYRAVLCYFALYPINAFFSINMLKDIIFAAACLIFVVLLLLRIRHEREHGSVRPVYDILLITAGFFFCVFRNNGWYAFLLGFPVYIFFNRKKWKRLTLVFLLVVVIVSGYHNLLFDVLGISKSASAEALSIPLQQIARVAKQHPEELESKEFQVLEDVFYNTNVLGEKYLSYISDPIKFECFDAKAYDIAPKKYMESWVKLGLRHPVTYIEAFLLQNYGYWYPDLSYYILLVGMSDFEEESWLAFGLDPGLTFREDRETTRYHLYVDTLNLSTSSPLSFVFSLGLMPWLLLVSVALLILKGQGALASPFIFIAMLWVTTLASPVYCMYRYLYGLVVCVPLCVALALGLPAKSCMRAEERWDGR